MRGQAVRRELRIRHGHVLHGIRRKDGGVTLHEVRVGRPEHEFSDRIGEGRTGNAMIFLHCLGGRFVVGGKKHVEGRTVFDLRVKRPGRTEGE